MRMGEKVVERAGRAALMRSFAGKGPEIEHHQQWSGMGTMGGGVFLESGNQGMTACMHTQRRKSLRKHERKGLWCFSGGTGLG